jgi:hypothetical protein
MASPLSPGIWKLSSLRQRSPSLQGKQEGHVGACCIKSRGPGKGAQETFSPPLADFQSRVMSSKVKRELFQPLWSMAVKLQALIFLLE